MAISKSPNRFNQKPTNRFSFTTTISSPSSSFSSSSSSESMMEETIKNAESVIEKWEIDGRSSTRFISIFHENRGEAAVFINCVKGLHRAMRFLVSHDLRSEKLALSQRVMQVAMKRLEREFYLILSDNREYLEPGSVSSLSSQSSIDSEEEERQLQISDSDVKQPSTIAISNLRLIADTMIGCGYGKECIVLYKIIRKSTIDEALFHLGIQPYTSSSINKIVNSPHFNDHVKNWLAAVQIVMKTLFRGEKLLCDRMFASSVRIRDSCFENSTKEGAMNLFAFPELVARCKKPKPETIFAMMELYNSISDLGPEIESLFSNESVSSVKTQALSSLHKLGDFIRTALGEMESSIHKDSSKLTLSTGGIHPLNNHVMTYLSSLSDYNTALSDIMSEDSQTPNEVPPPAVSAKLARIILVLLCKLDGKSKLHSYAALSYLFLANNLHFIIEKVRATNLKFILGEEWITDHEKKLKRYVSSYESMSWNKVISCLPENSYPLVSPEKARDCFRRLCSKFEEVYGKQTSWIVVDETMRDMLKASIANKLVPVYEEFYGKHLMTLGEDERCIKMLMRLSPENMAKYLSELFAGTSAVVRSSWSYSLILPVVSLSHAFRSLRIQNTIIRLL